MKEPLDYAGPAGFWERFWREARPSWGARVLILAVGVYWVIEMIVFRFFWV